MRFPIPSLDAFAASLVNHLWQSTAVALAVWLFTLALRNNRADVRYRLWMAASLKFLLPFSLLIAAGALFHPAGGMRIERPAVTAAMEQMVEPFSHSASSVFASPAAAGQPNQPVAWLFFLLWAAGALAVAARWMRHWLRMRSVARAASPGMFFADVPVRSTSTLLEPGIFGLVRPVLLLPEGIAGRLTPSQMNAIVAHELCHVKRRDNLTYALHMVVEVLFWFFPPVWWIGARLIDERELACDEAVLRSGNQAETYAESIVSVCKFCVESPLACAAGVSGSDLKKRIVRIMSERIANRLGMSRKILLAAACFVAVAAPTSVGIFHAAQTAVLARAQDAPADIPKFDVASIKPNKSGEMRMMFRFTPDGMNMQGIPPQLMLTQAFNVEDDCIVGAPAWVKTDRFDIEAKVAPEDAPRLDKLKREERMAMLQPLLQDRFNLKFHHETREMPVYVLVLAKGGSKLKPAGDDTTKMPRMMMGIGSLEANGAQMDMLTHVLSGQVGRTVIDKTGLTGKYDFSLHFMPEHMPSGMGQGPGPGPGGPGGGPAGAPAGGPPPPDASAPGIFTAIQEQLGLKLESEKGPVDVIVIDHIDKPSEN
jgi:bla regulator protein BlaR1